MASPAKFRIDVDIHNILNNSNQKGPEPARDNGSHSTRTKISAAP